VVWVYKKFICK